MKVLVCYEAQASGSVLSGDRVFDVWRLNQKAVQEIREIMIKLLEDNGYQVECLVFRSIVRLDR